jgi:hypothetical protein
MLSGIQPASYSNSPFQMLHHPMKRILTVALWAFAFLPVPAQVSLDTPLRFTGTAGQAGVSGTAPPEQASALLTVEAAVLDHVRLATVTTIGDTINLTMVPAGTAPLEGVVLRYVAPSSQSGKRWISVNSAPPRPFVRTDGEPIPFGQITTGSVCEVVATADSFVLLGPALRGCPAGTVAITERSCIATNRVLGLSFYSAVDHCTMRGGSLCTWGEYVAACYLVGNQLNGMFTNWEWIDDTSNHTQTADQVGRTSCMSQRSAGPLDPGGSTRCCYRPR